MKMKINFSPGICLIIISCLLTQTTAKCPSVNVMLPCRCEHENIYCGGNHYYDLQNRFVTISSSLTEDEKHFKVFYFNNTAINELAFNVFYDITFETININSAFNLSLINTNAFLSTNCFVKSFQLSNTPYGNNSDSNNIFHALNAMIIIEYIDNTNTSITSLPSNVFSVLNKLQTLDIYNNPSLKTIGDNAFYELNELSLLLLNSNPIDQISDHALSFREKNTRIDIVFNSMPNLSSKSFSIHAFDTINRSFELYLCGDKGLTYMDENIFAGVLSNGNAIHLYETPLECDCRMFWLYENKNRYQNLIFEDQCTDGMSIFIDRQNYTHC